MDNLISESKRKDAQDKREKEEHQKALSALFTSQVRSRSAVASVKRNETDVEKMNSTVVLWPTTSQCQAPVCFASASYTSHDSAQVCLGSCSFLHCGTMQVCLLCLPRLVPCCSCKKKQHCSTPRTCSSNGRWPSSAYKMRK